MLIKLPNGIETSDGEWTKEIELDDMTGEEEDILADQTRASHRSDGLFAKSTPRRISEILSRCTVRIGDMRRPQGKTRYHLPDFFAQVWSKGYTSDRVFGLIRLRQLSLGSDYIVSVQCPNCKADIQRAKFDLDSFAVKETSIEIARTTQMTTLPRSGDTVAWRFLAGEADEEAVQEAARMHKSEFLSAVMYIRIKAVNGGPPPGGLDYVKQLKTLDRRTLTRAADDLEGGIETKLEFTCTSCSYDFVRQLDPMGGGFFFPEVLPAGKAATSTSRSQPSQTLGAGPAPKSSDFQLESEPSTSAG